MKQFEPPIQCCYGEEAQWLIALDFGGNYVIIIFFGTILYIQQKMNGNGQLRM